MSRLVVALALAGCGGSVDLAGTYHLTSRLESSVCGGELRDLSLPSYAVMSAVDGGYEVRGYDDAALTIELPGISYEKIVFDTPIDNGWSGTKAAAGIPSEMTTCALLFIKARATLAGPTLTIDLTTYNQLDASPCTSDEARRRGDSMPCVDDERYAGDRL